VSIAQVVESTEFREIEDSLFVTIGVGDNPMFCSCGDARFKLNLDAALAIESSLFC
jgi:hypothetical protein